MGAGDVLLAGEVGDGAGDFENAGIGAGRSAPGAAWRFPGVFHRLRRADNTCGCPGWTSARCRKFCASENVGAEFHGHGSRASE